MLALNAQWVHWLYGCACAGIFFFFLFSNHNSFSRWKCIRDIGKWIYDIYFWLVLAIVCFFFARAQFNSFAWTFCGSISMKRYKCIECITRFSVCFHWQTWNGWLKWVNNNWMLKSTTPLDYNDQQAKWCISMIAVKSEHIHTTN